jgi:ribosomal protein S15P/S13E
MPRKKTEQIEEVQEEKAEEKPVVKKLPKEHFEKRVLELAEAGLTSEKIGEKLRSEKLHPQEYGKISKILKEKGKYIQPDVKNLETKLEKIRSHAAKNKQDKRAIRERERIAAQLRRMKNFFQAH